ncbi:hypothetical protein [Streptomyces hygroscopicus]|uniref:hypothetical protein n=1 Tax=Streptomyces sp. KHY 26 TaxID=3097359 RepID=UPI002555306A|nr:hypothetical protein [Streptomyces hygroscopicus]
MSVTGMAWSALLVSVAVPAAVRALRHSPLWNRISVPAPLALPLLVLTHAWAILAGLADLGPPGAALVTESLLPVTAVLFWLPVLTRTRHRLDEGARCLYLFLAAPLLDLPAVAVIAAGHSAAGLAMIVGMLPLGGAAAALTWSWADREEREARRLAPNASGGDPLAR